jgi:hypothetical protein
MAKGTRWGDPVERVVVEIERLVFSVNGDIDKDLVVVRRTVNRQKLESMTGVAMPRNLKLWPARRGRGSAGLADRDGKVLFRVDFVSCQT